jgi:hypothetical protein
VQEDLIATYEMKCRGNPPRMANEYDAHIKIEINLSAQPWKWLRLTAAVLLVDPTVYSIPTISTDPDGSWAQANPDPQRFINADGSYADYVAYTIPGGSPNETTSYYFGSEGLRYIELWPNGRSRSSFPYTCVRQ